MNILDIMGSLWMESWLKEKLKKMGISEKDMEWVNFGSIESLNKFAEKVGPELLKKNPKMVGLIKWCSWLSGSVKERVNNVIDGL